MIIKFSLSSEYMHIYIWVLGIERRSAGFVASDFYPLNHLDSGREIREDKWRAEYDQDIKYILYTYEIVKN